MGLTGPAAQCIDFYNNTIPWRTISYKPRRDPYLPLSREEASLFFRLLVRRYERGSLVVTSNKSFIDWGEIFNDQVLATAILDRLLHYSTTLNIKGESYRLKEKRRAGLLGRPKPAADEAEEEAPAT